MTKRLFQKIADDIKNEIIQSKLPMGEKLPAERLYAEQYKVSRTVIREAFISLEIEGWIEVKKGSGIYLKYNLTEQTLPSNRNQANSNESDIGAFELLQARQILESNVAACAASIIGKNDIRRLTETLAIEQENNESVSISEDADRKFHLIIAESTQNQLLLDMTKQLWNLRDKSEIWRQLHERIDDKSYHQQWLQDHRLVLTQLQQRNEEGAKQAMWQHLENVKNVLFTLSDTEDPNFDGYLFN